MDDVSGFDSSAPVKNQQVTVTIDGNTTAFNVNIFASTYTVTFNSNGGTTVASQIANYNTATAVPAPPTKTGYTFGGWYTNAECQNAHDFSTLVTSDTTLYAKWTINNYTVIFNSQGGSTVSNKSVDYNNSITAPTAPTKTGYTFGGWYKEAGCINTWNFIADTVTTDTIIYAKWTINNYTAAFNSQGGSAVTSDTADYNNAITAPAAPTKTGYTFKGWYKEVTCLNVWDFITDKVTLDTTLYAKWTINNYTATFNSQGGSVVSNKNADYNNAITSPTAPTKTGYTFEGWYKEAGCLNAWNFTTDKVTLDTTLYAKWIAKPVTGVSLDKIEASLKVGETTTFIATVNPDDANNKNVTWSSSNDAIAIVDNTGKVAAVGKGTATITVTTLDGNIKATALINVVAPSLSYQGQVQNVGWQNWVTDGGTIGSVGQGLRLETLRLKLNDAPKGMKVKYRVQVQNIGWQDWKYDGDLAGTVGQSLRIETIQIELENAPGYSIQYRGQVQNVGWQNWTEDGAICGTVGMSLRLETLQIKLVKYDNNKAPESPTNLVSNNNTGSTINLKWDVVAGANSYNIYRSTDNVKYVPVGTAVNEISFTDSKLIPDTTYFYKVSAVNKVGEGNQTQSISVRTKSPSLSYQGQVENVGWQNWVTDGGTIGTVGLGLRLETLRLKLNDAPAGMKVKYRVQIQNIGWQDWKYDGDLEGTVGQSLRIETIQIELENAPGYSIQYRGQVQNIGWQSWTEDGAICGTVGFCCSNQIFF